MLRMEVEKKKKKKKANKQTNKQTKIEKVVTCKIFKILHGSTSSLPLW